MNKLLVTYELIINGNYYLFNN